MINRISTCVLIVLLLSFTLCSCRQRIVLSGDDEFTMSDWTYTGEYGMSAILKFEDTTSTFSVYDNDNITVSVTGYYKIVDNTLTITDKNLLQDITFTYELMGDTIKITYDNDSIIMNILR